MIVNSPLELIGNTPLLKLTRLAPKNGANVYLKLEMFNLTGSVKDRAALGMIENAAKKGLLKKGSVLIESSSGNLGIAIAVIAAVKGYRFICVVDPKIEEAKVNSMRAFGAQIVRITTPDKDGHYSLKRIEKVKNLLKITPNSFNLDQYANPANPYSHTLTTGPEIFKDLNGKVDVLVAGIGTGGTCCGTASYLKKKIKNIQIVAVEPVGSTIFGGKYKPFLQQGSGANSRHRNVNTALIDENMQVSDKNAFITMRKLARLEGILAGGTAGGILYVALKKAATLLPSKNIVAILPDHGDRYLTTAYSDVWLKKHGIKPV